MKSNLSVWFRAVRPFSFTGSVIPVIVGAIYAANETKFQLGYFILSVLGVILMHSSVNLLSDFDDYENKVDTEDSLGSSGVIREKLLEPRKVLIGGYVSLVLGSLIGIYLWISKGMFVLFLGILGALLGYSYTGRPLALKYRGLGAPLVFLIFGPLLTIGGYYVQTQKFSLSALLISIPLGLLTTAILHANDIRDISDDKKAGIKTFSTIFGENHAKNLYYFLVFTPFIIILLLAVCKIVPLWSLICLITIPTAIKNANKLRLVKNLKSDLITFDKETAELDGKFGVLLIISLLIPYILK